MATTTWIAGSGDWNTASNWSDGVPTATDSAVFADNPGSSTSYTVTGAGAAASLTIMPNLSSNTPSFAGSLLVGSFTDNGVAAILLGSGALSFTSGVVTASQFQVQAGATLGSGALTLSSGTLTGTLGVLSNPIVLVGSDAVVATGTLAGPITGTGVLHLAGNVVLANPGNTYSGGTAIGPSDVEDLGFGSDFYQVELAATGAAGTGPLALGGGSLILDPGVTVGAITAATTYNAIIHATDQSDTVFAGQMDLTYLNGSGHPTIIGATAPGPEFTGEGPEQFGQMTVQGGSGSVTVFGGDNGGTFQGGSAGHNVLVGGANLSAYTVGDYVTAPGVLAGFPTPVALYGGGDGDLLVLSGTENGSASDMPASVLVAADGSETLTGSGSTANAFFFGGTGSDLIALGGGYSVVTAGSGAETIAGGSGRAAIFAGSGPDLILGGTGAEYIQAGAGNATLFAGAGAEQIGVVAGQAGGSLTVSGFHAGTDQLDLQGYAAAPSVTAGSGNTILTFSDHTQVTLLGVTSVSSSVFT